MWRGDGRVLSPEAVARRAGGRRLFNAVRQLKRELRWAQVARLRLEGYSRPMIAVRLGVSERTIARDLVALMAYGRTPVCPTCGRPSAIPAAYAAY